jgi:hypothetical protein
VIIPDLPPHARVYRALPLRDNDAPALSGDVVIVPREHFDELVARVALSEAATQLGCPGLTG